MANGNVIAEAYRIVRLRYTLGQFVNLSLDQLVNEVRHEAELLRYGPIRTFVDHNDDRPSQRPVRQGFRRLAVMVDRLGQ